MRTAGSLLSGPLLIALSSLGPAVDVGVGDGVEIRPAGAKGLGAFATRDLPAGAYLGQYTGRVTTFDEAMAAERRGETSGAYFACVEDGPFGERLVVDAEDASSGWPRFINHSKRRANCQNIEARRPLPGVRVPVGLFVQTLRPVSAGEELLVDYGDWYWTSRGLLPVE
jgi:SET domain-containing protein